MKPFLFLTLGIASTATAGTILSWNGTTDQFTMTTQVTSPPPGVCCINYASGSFSGTFSLEFSGLGSIYPPGTPFPGFFLTIPVDFSLFNDGIPYDDGASACVFTLCYSSDTGYPFQHTYLLQYAFLLASDQPFLVDLSLTTSTIAQAYQSELVNFATMASATITVDFGDLVLKDLSGNDVTSEVSFTVTPSIPEPGSFVLAGAGLLALTFRRIRVASHRAG